MDIKPLNEKSWMTSKEQLFISSFIRKNAKGDVLELGCFRAGTSSIIRQALDKKYNFYTIDSFDEPEFQKYPEYNCYTAQKILDMIPNKKSFVISSRIENVNWNRKVWLTLHDANHDFFWMVLFFCKFQDYTDLFLIHDYSNDHKGVVEFIEFVKMLKTWNIVYIVDTLVLLEKQ